MHNKSIKFSCFVAALVFAFLRLLKCDWLDALSWSISCGMGANYLYNRYLWKIIPGDKMPDISGKYIANCKSTYLDGYLYQSTLSIEQTLTSIKVTEHLDDGSRCESITASFTKLTTNGDWALCYTYQTYPVPGKSDDMHMGTAILMLKRDGNLNGTYFTNRVEQTAGTMILKKTHP